MEIKDFLDLGKLQRIQDQFSAATGLAAIAVDSQGNYITKGSNFTEFCMKYTRGNPEGQRRCVKCDQECSGTYFCHAGLMDFSHPILVEGVKVGAIIGGQVLPAPPEEAKFEAIARELGIPAGEYLQALRKVPVRSEKTIRAASELLGSVVNELVNLEYLKALNKKKMETFDQESGRISASIEVVRGKMGDLKRFSSMENILAINASIEAGRAGSAGVGFAVVAKEMGQLSQQSTAVHQEVAAHIDQISDSVKAMCSVGL